MSMAVTTDAGIRERGRRATSPDSPRDRRPQRRSRETDIPRGAFTLDLVREKAGALLGLLSRLRVVAVVVAVLLVIMVSLYSPLQAYWCAWRDNVTQQQELAELEETNEEYQSDIDRLQTTEGVEDEARRRGYVYEGETQVVIEGELPEDDDEETESEDDDVAWYITLGDLVFGYES